MQNIKLKCRLRQIDSIRGFSGLMMGHRVPENVLVFAERVVTWIYSNTGTVADSARKAWPHSSVLQYYAKPQATRYQVNCNLSVTISIDPWSVFLFRNSNAKWVYPMESFAELVSHARILIIER